MSSCRPQTCPRGSWTSLKGLVPTKQLQKKDTSMGHFTYHQIWTANSLLEPTWKMAYIMQVRGRLWEYSDTVKMFRPHLLRFSSSLDSNSSLSVLTPKREMLLLDSDGPCETFLTPLICVISCCFCCFFFSRVLDVGEGISTSFCLSEGQITKLLWVFSPTQSRF